MIAQGKSALVAHHKVTPRQARAIEVRESILEYLRAHGSATIASLVAHCRASSGSVSHCVVMLSLDGKMRRVGELPARGSRHAAAVWGLGDDTEEADVETMRVHLVRAEQTGLAARDPLVAALFGPAPAAPVAAGVM